MASKRSRQLSPKLVQALNRRNASSEVMELFRSEGVWTLRTLCWLEQEEYAEISSKIVQESDRLVFQEVVTHAQDVGAVARWEVRAGHVHLDGYGATPVNGGCATSRIEPVHLSHRVASSPPACSAQWCPPPLPASVGDEDTAVKERHLTFLLEMFAECGAKGRLWDAGLSVLDYQSHMAVWKDHLLRASVSSLSGSASVIKSLFADMRVQGRDPWNIPAFVLVLVKALA